MSLLTNYEGLRHQIERLVRENEELKKLVRLIRENHELKSAIKTQAAGLGISGFTSGHGETTAGPSQRQGVFLTPPLAAANEPVLEEVGVMALASLADMLNGPQPNPSTGPIVSPMTGPFNTLLASPGPITQNSALASLLAAPMNSHLASPMAMPAAGTLVSSLGLPSTGPLTPSTLSSSMGLPSTGPLTPSTMSSSMGLPSTGPLTPSTMASSMGLPSTGPLTPSTMASSMGLPSTGPLTPSTMASSMGLPSTGPLTPSSQLPGSVAVSPAVNNTRGPRVPEASRKSALDLERKLAHRKTTKYPESSREPKQLAWERLVGEIAFQLDRRILSSIFPERVRLYGFTVSNIPEKIIQASLNPSNHKLDEELCQTLTQRYVSIMNRLHSLGYNGRVHPALTEQLVNDFGILRERPELAVSEGGSFTVDFLQRVLVETVHPSMLSDALLLLSCLNQLAHDDGKPMFIW
ncbi:spermatogenesis and centriole associated 1 [Phyllostomus discolor]|uniref:Spermatogenesis and centriole associated 1 n=1 Tax=Phyllostomus discolor TaxID=89673 RepID=A0A834E292_9CHIR|nr:spermatogenesis and centriole associated 1 [Phyllostomus discolor]